MLAPLEQRMVTLPDAHALSIGISQYRHLRELPATQDALDVASVLRDGALCGYPDANVRLLLDGAATKAAILAELDGLAARTTEHSTVFLYFSGHGGRAAGASAGTSGETCFLMPVDGRSGSEQALRDTAISGDELSARLQQISAARLTVVLDCCRASGVAEPRDIELDGLAPQLTGSILAPLAHGRGRAVLAASRSDGYAYVVPGARNGVFTGHLLDGLRGAAVGTGGVIRICDLFHHVQQRVSAEHAHQRPVFKADLEENYPIALFQGGSAPPVAVPPRPDGYAYDVFLSYSHSDKLDRAFVTGVVVPLLERLGLRVCLEHRDFGLGLPRIAEIERAVATSRYTVGVFTPSYVAGPFEELQADLARFQSTEARLARFIPLLRRPCPLALGIRMAALLDVSDDGDAPTALQRLAVQLREPPRPRLSAWPS
jgi:hypothetical protein